MKLISADNPKYDCNPLTISFSKEIEKDYMNTFTYNSINHVRLSLLLAIFFYGVFGILDLWIAPEVKDKLWIIRFLVFSPFVIATYLFTFSKYFKKYMQFSIFSVVLLAGIGIIGMIIIAPDPVGYTYYAGLILVFLYGYTFFKLRFIWATIAGWTIVIFYELAGIFIIDTPIEIFINNNFFFLCGNLIGMIAGYSIEYYSRRDFIQNILLEEEKMKVDEARRCLEDKVDKRTLELVTVNKELIKKIDEQNRTEETLKSKIEFESFLTNLSTQFININYNQLDNEIRNAIQAIGNFLQVDRSYLYVNLNKQNDQPPTFELYHQWIKTPENNKNSSISVLDLSWTIGEISKKNNVIINGQDDFIVEAENDKQMVNATCVKSLLQIPLLINEKLFGFIGLDSLEHEKKWSEENISLIKLIGDLLILAFDRKNNEEKLKKSEKEYRSLFEKSSDVVFISTPEGKFIDINQAGIDLFGYNSKSEILKCNIGENLYLNPNDRLEFQKAIERDDQIKDFEVKLKNKEGKEILALETTTAFRDKSGDLIAYQGIIRDITKKHKFEQHLFQSQKMESIGMLAGGIAHDFNNILTALKGYTDIALMKIENESFVKKQITGISKGIERAETLIRQLLAFGRKQIIEPNVININDLIKNLERMLTRLIGEDINLFTSLTDDIDYIKADPGQLEQILVNLVINARDAINQKKCLTKDKKITIETKSEYLDFNYANSHPEIKVGNYLMIAVSDTGIGMNKEVQSKIYEPFFTTKELGKGTGLGLSTVYGIIKQNNGHVYTYSEIDNGTTFKIYWPTTDEEIESTYSTDLEAELLNGKETVLFVEDDYEVRNTMCEALESLNYKIIEASNGLEAMKIVKRNNIKLDLLITDVVMPEMGGKELADEIIKYFPGIKILFTSGYTSNHIVRSNRLEKGINFLHKPFSIKDLSQKVRFIIDN